MTLMKHLESEKSTINRQVEALKNLTDFDIPRKVLPALIVRYMRTYGYTTDEAIKAMRKDLQNLKD